jgi:hypothetical protein
MSHFTYNLNKLSQEEQQVRYEIIKKFTATSKPEVNAYFAYLPYVSNPTNNYQKYPNNELNTIILEL